MSALMTQRDREDVALVAMTMAWCAGLDWQKLPASAPDGKPWEHDREAFIQTALCVLGHREIHARTYIAESGEVGIRAGRVFAEREFDRLPTPEDGYTGWKS